MACQAHLLHDGQVTTLVLPVNYTSDSARYATMPEKQQHYVLMPSSLPHAPPYTSSYSARHHRRV